MSDCEGLILPHQLIASDEYWHDTTPPPFIGMNQPSDASIQSILKFIKEANEVSHDKEQAYELGSLVLSMVGNCESTALSEGDLIPIFPFDTNRIIKIVTDTRRVFPRTHPRVWCKSNPAWLERFDYTAREMVRAGVYIGSDACATVAHEKKYFHVGIKRAVLYMHAVKDGRRVIGIKSDIQGEIPKEDIEPDVPRARLMQPGSMVAGVNTKSLRGKEERRIVRAEILEPTGKIKFITPPDGHKPQKKEKKVGVFFPRPGLAPTH